MSIYPPIEAVNAAYADTVRMCRSDDGWPDGPAVTSLWQAGGVTVEELGCEVLRAIEEDVADRVVPWDVYDFSELHNYVDANCYTLAVCGYDGSDEGTGLANAVDDWVAHALRGNRPSSLDFGAKWHEDRRFNHRHWPPEEWLAYVAVENGFGEDG